MLALLKGVRVIDFTTVVLGPTPGRCSAISAPK